MPSTTTISIDKLVRAPGLATSPAPGCCPRSLTLFTTPIVYIYLSRFAQWVLPRHAAGEAPAAGGHTGCRRIPRGGVGERGGGSSASGRSIS
jgi:hypothetical protein